MCPRIHCPEQASPDPCCATLSGRGWSSWKDTLCGEKYKVVIRDPIGRVTKENKQTKKNCLTVQIKTIFPQIILIVKNEGPSSISHVLVK